VLLFAAASTAEALDAVTEQFRLQHGNMVRTNYAATSMLAQQVIQGAEPDVFVSASEPWADRLAERGLIAQRRDLLGNRLVVIVPQGARFRPTSLDELRDEHIRRLALGDSDSVPAGVYAKQALSRAALWGTLEPKVVSSADVRQALSFVETGAADAGIVYATDARASESVEVTVEVDPQLTDPIRYPVMLLKHGAGRPEARQFYQFLASQQAAAVFRRFGFSVNIDQTAEEIIE
jgi:molybdate transport system substrate-binding protein